MGASFIYAAHQAETTFKGRLGLGVSVAYMSVFAGMKGSAILQCMNAYIDYDANNTI